MKVHTVNKKKRTRRRKTAAKPKKDKPVAKKKRTRRRRRAPAAAAPPARRRRRRRTSNPSRRRASRRRNPSLLGGGGGIQGLVKTWGTRFAGKLLAAYVIRKWGSPGNIMGGPAYNSPTAGSSLTVGQYFMAAAVVRIVAKFAGRFVNGKELVEGADDLLLTKLVWTEGISRSAWARTAFGNVAEGQISWSPSQRQLWINQGGLSTAMQGFDGLVEASPLDGYRGLVEASPLDGGMMPSSTPAAESLRAGYMRAGSANPYLAPFMGGRAMA